MPTSDRATEASPDTMEMDVDDLYRKLANTDLVPLWRQQARLNTDAPKPATKAWLWKWSSIIPLAEQAGAEVPIHRGGDRRVLALANPGLGGLPFATSTLWGAVQYLGPHESAPAHRHSASAIRFILSGDGVSTTVNGDECEMSAGDLIVTPNWHWHDHSNTGDQYMAWFDGLDLPLVVGLDAVFFQRYPEDKQPVCGRNMSQNRFTSVGHVFRNTASNEPSTQFTRLFRYPWRETADALDQAESAGRGHVTVEYTNPLTGQSALPTMGCYAHRILPGGRTATSRQVGSQVFVVIRGSGRSVINGVSFDWQQGDMFAIPSWAEVDHEVNERADLFAITDEPALSALGLYRREERVSHQPITQIFQPR